MWAGRRGRLELWSTGPSAEELSGPLTAGRLASFFSFPYWLHLPYHSSSPLPWCPAPSSTQVSSYSLANLLLGISNFTPSPWQTDQCSIQMKNRRVQEGAVVGQSLPEKGKCQLSSQMTSGHRKHLDLAQERVLPTSKTASSRRLGRAGPLK